jgi:ribosomal-protein-alanine N-acetyltransferase
MLYRLHKPADFDALYAIETVCFQPPLRFTRRYLRSLIDAPDSATWIAEEDSRPIAFAVLEWFGNGPEITAYLQTIEVLSAYRGRGVATELLRHVEDSARQARSSSLWLHVDAANSNAIRLYEKHHFALESRKAHYYGPGTEALIYRKALAS